MEKEIGKLKELLDKEGISYEHKKLNDEWECIYFPAYNDGNYTASVMQGKFTYGNKDNLLEYMDSAGVKGNLSATDILGKLKKLTEK
jgi:hypothetical protein